MAQHQDQRPFNGGPQKRRFEGPERGPAKRPTGAPETVYRLLVSTKRVGSLIGKQGSIIKQMREETGARIIVADAPPSSDERMVVIQAQEVVHNVQFGPAQLALFRVHNRVLEAIAQEAEKTGTVPDGGRVTTRLLIEDTQAGSIIGRKGDIIKQIRDNSKAFIKVLTQEENPSIAAREDRVVQMVGEPAQVQLALEIVSKQLRENPPKGQGRPFHPPATNPQQQMFKPPPVFNPNSTPLTFGTAYQIEPTTGALLPVASLGQSSDPLPVRFNEIGRDQVGGRVFTQEHFGRLRSESEDLGGLFANRGDGVLGEYDPSGRLERAFRERGGVLARNDLGSLGTGRNSFVGDIFDEDRGIVNRTVDYSRVAVTQPPSDYRQQGMQSGGDQGFGTESLYERRASSPPWARRTNQDAAGGLGNGALGGGLLGMAGSLGAGAPVTGSFGTGGFGVAALGSVPGIGSTVITAKMTISKSMVGPVIGKRGANVQQIRQLSGASIKVHDHNVKEDERIVEIEGSPEAVAAAQSLVQAVLLQAEQDARSRERLPPGYASQQPMGGYSDRGPSERAPGFGGWQGQQQRR